MDELLVGRYHNDGREYKNETTGSVIGGERNRSNIRPYHKQYLVSLQINF